MKQFYSISDNTSSMRRMPEVSKIISGIENKGVCPACGANIRFPRGDLQVRLGKTPIRVWPDSIACGDYPCFVVSQKFVDAMKKCELDFIIGGTVTIVNLDELINVPSNVPKYYWIDGENSSAAEMDFEKSGFVDVRFCGLCNNRTDNISLTYTKRRNNPPPGDIFVYDESKGLHIFTTNLSPAAFYCTQSVLDCARKYKLINLTFTRVELGPIGRSENM